MEIHVTENAINSLEVGLEFYNKFLVNLNSIDISVYHFGNLKFAVVAIQNAIELLSKSILLDVNELIVFKVDIDNDPVVCNMLRMQFEEKKRKAHLAYNAVFSNNNYKTIEYSRCILLIRKIFDGEIKDENYNTLRSLGEYRNTLTHLGYASIYEWYKILVVLNKTLELILKFYMGNISNSKKYFSENNIEEINKTLKKSKQALPDLWLASNETILEDINKKLDDYFEDSAKINEIKQISEYGFYESIDFIYSNKGKNITLSWNFKYSYLNESIIIIDNTMLIVGFISIDNENLKYIRDEHNLPTKLNEVGINVPKEAIKFEEDKMYNFKSKRITSIIKCEAKTANILIEMYLKKQDLY